MQSNSSSGIGASPRQRGADFLRAVADTVMFRPARLAVRFRRLRWAVVGVDRTVLAKCSHGEQSAYGALSWLMLGTACFTATGLAIKAKTGFDLGFVLTAFVWFFFGAFALALETAVIGTLKAGGGAVRSVGLRFAIGSLLVCAQVLPLLVMGLNAKIALELQQQSLAAQLSMKDSREGIADVKGLQQVTQKLTDAEAKATSEVGSPPPTPAVTSATVALEAANSELVKAKSAERKTFSTLQAYRSQLATAKDDVARDRVKEFLTKAQAIHVAVQAKVNGADAAVQNALVSLKVASEANQAQRADALAIARQAVASHSLRVGQVNAALTVDADRTRTLAERAAAPNFITESIALGRLAAKDGSVAALCLLALLAALLVDLLPVTVKFALRDGLYARLVSWQDDELLSQGRAARIEADLQLDQALLLKRNEVDGTRKFVEDDKGDLIAAKLAIQSQTELDAAEVGSSTVLTNSMVDGVKGTMLRIIELEQLVAQNPSIEPAYRDQMAIVLRDLQARAQSMAEELKRPGFSGGGAAGVGA